MRILALKVSHDLALKLTMLCLNFAFPFLNLRWLGMKTMHLIVFPEYELVLGMYKWLKLK